MTTRFGTEVQRLQAISASLLIGAILYFIGNPVNAVEPINEDQLGHFSSQIVFFSSQSYSEKIRRIQLLNPTTLQLQPFAVLENEYAVAGRVSPNGKYLAVSFQSTKDPDALPSLILINSENQRQTLVEDAVVIAWSPDSAHIVFRQGKSYAWGNSVVEIATGHTKALPLPLTDAVMDWSSNGSSLIVMAGRPEKRFEQRAGEFYPKRQLYVFDFDERSVLKPFTNPDEDCIWGQFSRESSKLAYYRRTYLTNRPVELCEVTNLKTNATTTIADFTKLGVRPSMGPRWSPDGNQLLWPVTRESKDGNLQFELMFIAADRSTIRSVSAKELKIDLFGPMDWR